MWCGIMERAGHDIIKSSKVKGMCGACVRAGCVGGGSSSANDRGNTPMKSELHDDHTAEGDKPQAG